jgi:RNA polymerase sigma factor (sigma-70 family)
MELQQFKQTVYPLKDKVFRTARALLRSREEAEDTMQEVFVKLWNCRHTLHEYRSIEAFAVTITRNLCLDKLKSARYKLAVDISSYDFDTTDASPYYSTELKDSLNAMQRLVEGLPEQQKLVVHLREVEEMEFEEIAEITGLNINHIRVVLSRARKALREGYTRVHNYNTQHKPGDNGNPGKPSGILL